MNEQQYGVQGGYGQPAGAPMYASSSGGYPPPPGGYPPPSGGYPPPPGGGYPPPPPGGGYPPPGQPPYGQPQYGGPPPPPPGAGLPPNTAAAIAYITFIPAVIFLVMDPYKRSNFVRFHAWQCIVLTGVWVLFAIIFGILSVVHILWILFAIVHALINLGLFIFWLIAIIKASKGERYHIPVVGDLAENFTGTV
jgi:uncharacterized membrane protein